MSQGNDWGTKNFDGPLGQLTANIAAGATGGIMDVNISSVEEGHTSGKNFINGVKNQFEAVM